MLESLFNKVEVLKACNFIKRRHQHRCFPVNIKNPFFSQNISGGCFQTLLNFQRNFCNKYTWIFVDIFQFDGISVISNDLFRSTHVSAINKYHFIVKDGYNLITVLSAANHQFSTYAKLSQKISFLTP